jgi:c-di-GMP phosphodiesterase
MDHPVLDQLLLGYGALFNAARRPHAARLTVHALRGEGAVNAQGVLELLASAWPAEHGPLAISATSESLLAALLDADMAPHLMLELPAFLAGDPGWAERIVGLARQGRALVLKGRPLVELSPEVLASLRYAVIEQEEDRRIGAPVPSTVPRQLPFVQSGMQTPAQAGDSFKRGALAVQGWPLGDVPEQDSKRRDVPTNVQSVMDLMQRLENDEPSHRIEAALKTNPALAFRLMRFINSPGVGLSVEVSSFQHALMLLGYRKLKRWLALLLASAVDDPNLKPLMFLAVRRGLLMENLAKVGGDEAQSSEAFICGVFSLLDRMLGQRFEHLLASIPVPEVVAQALLHGEGPCARPLAVAIAVESELPIAIQEAADGLMLSCAELNRAVLHTLNAARQLQTD